MQIFLLKEIRTYLEIGQIKILNLVSSQILVTKRLVFSSLCVSLYMYIVNVWYSLPQDGMAKINFKVLFD